MANPSDYSDDAIDFAELFARLRRGWLLILALAALGLATGLFISLAVSSKQSAVSAMRISFGFPGFERGTYPNGIKFQADDVRSPDVVNEAIKRLGIQSGENDIASKLRGAIGISGFISPNVIKERDKLRANGQTLPPYFADEYELSLSLPRDYPLPIRQRELLLAEIVNVYLEKFRRSFVQLPPEFDNVFASLKNADFVEYELILTKELQSLAAYLEQRIDATNETDAGNKDVRSQATAAKQFRSLTNNLSFQDLIKQTHLFIQIRLNDVLSQIYVQGLSKDRNYALAKMDYHLRNLEDQEKRLQEEEKVVTNLLAKTQERASNYVLAARTQNPAASQPLVDQGFVDSLVANDAYNFLVRRALDAGLALKRVQADKLRLEERRQRMEAFTKGEVSNQAAAITNTQKALLNLEASYQELLEKVRVVLDDYARQEYAHAVRVSMQARTETVLPNVMMGAGFGVVIGLALGFGLSLLKAPARRRLT